MQEIQTLQSWIRDSKNIVFFGGAGVSTESNIPDFRSQDGLYHLSYQYPPETILSHRFFLQKPEEFYREKMLYLEAQPNQAHLQLAKWEREGRLKGVITQNIDGLHQKAGSRHVVELHGSVLRNHCMQCGKAYTAEEMAQSQGVPRCTCGGVIKPDVVLYEESLNGADIEEAVRLIEQAEVLIVGGTSLAVYPAAGLIDYYKGDRLVLINRDATPYDRKANLLIQEKIGWVLGQIDA